VVDDESAQRKFMRSILHREDYRTIEAGDYRGALSVFKAHAEEVDIAVLDLRLPGGHGYDLASALLALKPTLKVLFVSGYAGSELCKFFNMDVTDVQFLQKPFAAEELLRRIRLVLGNDPRTGSAAAC